MKHLFLRVIVAVIVMHIARSFRVLQQRQTLRGAALRQLPRAGLPLFAVSKRSESTSKDNETSGDGSAPADSRPKLLRVRGVGVKKSGAAGPLDGREGGAQSEVPKPSAASQKRDAYTIRNGPTSSTPASSYVTVKLGTDADVESAEMEDRLRNAQNWVSKKLSDKDASLLNRAMGIEAEVMEALEMQEDELRVGSVKGGKKQKVGGSKNDEKSKGSSKVRMLQEFSTEETRAAAVVRGFLEMNPYICSGCGAPFQSNSGDSPGFLPKEKLQEHRKKAGSIRDKQEAIRILELAGMEIDSPAAEALLREALVPQEIISGVRALGKGEKVLENAEIAMRSGSGRMTSFPTPSGRGESEEDEEEGGSSPVSGSRIASIKESIAAIKDEEEEDALDSLEIDLEDLLSSIDGGESSDAVASTLVSKIASQSKKRQDVSKQTREAEEEGEDEDLLDGFEIDLEDLLSSAQDDTADAVAESLAGSIAKQLKSRQAAGKSSAPLSLINDIDLEIAGRGSNQIRASGGSADSLELLQREAAREGSRRPRNLIQFDSDDEQIGAGEQGDLSSYSETVCICQRCFRLQQYGQVEQSLRPGWSSHELLTAQRFEELLGVIKDTEAVVLCIIDLFDLQGSLLKNLKHIAGKNPIVIAANKADLFPKDVSSVRLTNWIHSEVKKFCDLQSPKESEDDKYAEIRERGYRTEKDKKTSEAGVLRRSNVHLVSCQSGAGVDKLLRNVMGIATENGNKVFVMGAANVGKSSFINRLLDTSYKSNSEKAKKKRNDIPQATVSNLPGTTLDFLKIRLPNGITMIDTPGLLNPGQLTAKLTTAELRQIIPSKPINAVTLRVSEGKCVLIGGLAIIELTEGRPFFFTFFVSNEVKLHPTDSTRAEEFISKHVGTLVTPPSSPERLAEIGPQESFLLDITGEDWETATTDIVIAGLGWISVTGPGTCTVKVTVPKGISVVTRPALLPYEAKHSTARFTGGRLEKKSRKPGAKNYGWRS